MNAKRLLQHAWILAGCAVALSVTPRALAAEPLTDADDIRAAWFAYDGLYNQVRIRHHVRGAKQVLEKAGADVDTSIFDGISNSLDAIGAARVKEKREDARAQLKASIRPLMDELLKIVPPVAAFDKPNDDASAVIVAWKPHQRPELVATYEVYRKALKPGRKKEPQWEKVTETSAAGYWKVDSDKIRSDWEYQYQVKAVLTETKDTPEGTGPIPMVINLGESVPVDPEMEWIHTGQWAFFLFVVLLSSAVIFYIQKARSGVKLQVRKISGLEAVDEAVGRATEMGRPVLYVPGIADINDIQTVASLTVLGRVANIAAEHDVRLNMPVNSPLTLTAAREIVQTAAMNAGRPDSYDETQVYFTTAEQFAYVASVTGTMVREKPATCFYMGTFFAESLILAETGNATGAIQIAGTAMPAQLPFFVAACDYTLIGEELFAASAYLSGEPAQLGSLKGQDFGKVIGAAIILIGVVCVTTATLVTGENSFVGDILDFIKYNLLTVQQ